MFKVATLAVVSIFLSGPVAPVQTGPGTRYFDGPPPIRFVRETAVPVFFIHPDRMMDACGLDKAPPGVRLIACVRRTNTGQAIMMLPHPCLSADEQYALIVCHETAHVNLWPGDHPL